MRNRRALVAAAVVAVTIASSVAPAEAHEFVASKTGTLVTAEKGKATFKFGSEKVTCETSVAGKVSATKEEDQSIEVKLENCEGFGAKLSASKIEDELEAEGSAPDFGADLVLKDEAAKCEVTLDGIGEEDTAEYSGTHALKIKTKAKGINYESSGGSCGTKEVVDTSGELEANTTAEIPCANMEWK